MLIFKTKILQYNPIVAVSSNQCDFYWLYSPVATLVNRRNWNINVTLSYGWHFNKSSETFDVDIKRIKRHRFPLITQQCGFTCRPFAGLVFESTLKSLWAPTCCYQTLHLLLIFLITVFAVILRSHQSIDSHVRARVVLCQVWRENNCVTTNMYCGYPGVVGRSSKTAPGFK